MSKDIETEVSRSKLHGLWALTNRELKKWYQQPFVFVMGIVQPILWLALLGKAMNLSAMIPSGIPGLSQDAIMMQTFGTTDYFSFMAMGMVAFTTVFTTAFVGMSVVWDKRLGFMNKVLSTPVSRSVIILSKVFAASIRAMFQAAIVAIIAFLLGLQLGTNFSAWSILGIFAIVFLISVGLSSMFTTLTLRATRMEMPQATFQLITLPLMFASSAYFPIDKMPQWLQVIASVNPISYTIDAVRRLMIFSDGFGQLPLDFAFVGGFAVIVTAICVVLSWRYLNK
ncbi:MAG: ABC transporter permease [Candidatus Bathyarchaeota archaeon]|nr:ABC transporter permease [Candidatus Bathyarchaeota archaeon]